MLSVAMKDARSVLSDLLNRVSYAHERVAITRHKKIAAYLVSEEDFQLIRLIEDKIDIEAARAAMEETEGRISLDELLEETDLE